MSTTTELTSTDTSARMTDGMTDADGEVEHQQVFPGATRGFLPELAALAVVIVWGSTFTLTKSTYTEIAPLAFGFARFIIIPVIAFAVLIIQARRTDQPNWWRIKRQDLPLFVLTGVCGYTFYQLGFMLGLAHTSPFSGSLMISLQPIVTLGIVTLLGERQPLLVWVGVLVSLAGVAMFLANGDGESQLLGNVISFAGGASFAVYQVFNRRLIRDYPPTTYSAYSTLFGAIPLLVICTPGAMRQDWGAISTQSWLTLAYMCVFPVYLAYIVWGWVIGKRGVAISGLTLLVPVVAGVIAVLFFNEAFGPQKLFGGALALAGLLVVQQANRLAQTRRAA
ncbi:MAG TPA: DMT family transporter [Thermomicrobiales bacterium]|nr:DMT family transporter [Thermomicrobiales bacterium]